MTRGEGGCLFLYKQDIVRREEIVGWFNGKVLLCSRGDRGCYRFLGFMGYIFWYQLLKK
jgi:hypothetical protein